MTGCRIAVEGSPGRWRTILRPGSLRGQLLGSPPDRVRVGLVATEALLLGGEEVRLDVEVGTDACLELVDVAATVAYGRGGPAAWHARLRLAEGARLFWAAQPLVVADGADLLRTLDVDLAPSAGLWLRETVVLGRAGERGGELLNRLWLRREAEESWREDLRLSHDIRGLPGVLGSDRVLDTLLWRGVPTTPPAETTVFALPDGSGLARWSGRSLACSPLVGIQWLDGRG